MEAGQDLGGGDKELLEHLDGNAPAVLPFGEEGSRFLAGLARTPERRPVSRVRIDGPLEGEHTLRPQGSGDGVDLLLGRLEVVRRDHRQRPVHVLGKMHDHLVGGQVLRPRLGCRVAVGSGHGNRAGDGKGESDRAQGGTGSGLVAGQVAEGQTGGDRKGPRQPGHYCDGERRQQQHADRRSNDAENHQ